MEDRCVDCTARGLAASHHKFQGIVFREKKEGRSTFAKIKKLKNRLSQSFGKLSLSRDGSVGSGSPDSDGHGRRVSPPSKLDKLRFAGYSAEFLDRVTEPNGNIPDKYSLGEFYQFLYILTSKCLHTFVSLEIEARRGLH